ncbi:hypothetical protein K474DRAFT_361734 [Panus rudis PR-1116 ss-1]|nr:hypothetical protein K474DRAFT_361734 [Panus rudis PR-1116 ss-1]
MSKFVQSKLLSNRSKCATLYTSFFSTQSPLLQNIICAMPRKPIPPGPPLTTVPLVDPNRYRGTTPLGTPPNVPDVYHQQTYTTKWRNNPTPLMYPNAYTQSYPRHEDPRHAYVYTGAPSAHATYAAFPGPPAHHGFPPVPSASYAQTAYPTNMQPNLPSTSYAGPHLSYHPAPRFDLPPHLHGQPPVASSSAVAHGVPPSTATKRQAKVTGKRKRTRAEEPETRVESSSTCSTAPGFHPYSQQPVQSSSSVVANEVPPNTTTILSAQVPGKRKRERAQESDPQDIPTPPAKKRCATRKNVVNRTSSSRRRI